MRQEKLSDLLDISIGRTPSRSKSEYWGKGHPWVSIRDLRSKFVDATKEQITDTAIKAARCKVVKKGTLLFSFKLTIGKMAFAGCDLFTNEAIAAFAIKDEKKLNSEFLFYALQSVTYEGSNQAVMGKTLNLKSLGEIKIPLPSLYDQIRIAHLLGRVEGLISQRKEHLQQLDELLKSVFLEMFSPSVKDYEDWPLLEIKDLAEKHKGAMRTGPFGSNLLHSEFTEYGDVAVLGIDNAVQNRFAWGERRYIDKEKYQKLKNYRVYPGDVIVTIMGTIGRSAVIPDDIPLAINTKHLAAITLNKKIANPIFVSYSIHSSPYIWNQFRSKNRGAIMSGLNLGLIKETKLRLPPIESQHEFASIHEKVEQVKRSYQRSLNDLESLYGALSQKVFKGDLDLSQVPLQALEQSTAEVATALPGQEEQSSDEDDNIVIKLPDSNKLPGALTNKGTRKDLLAFWLEDYCKQIGKTQFSASEFFSIAHTRITELHPDAEFEFSLDDYDQIKNWVFEALNSGRLQQAQNVTGQDENGEPILGNRIELKAGIKP
ncbi:restriction endonuclease subunit S [Vibrio parahaemolyticus]|uniref:restriction endonuclease subunit S n=1 Tax=Vibrio parahaemolyticus TaxID=670 RepID=UPI002360DA64|nr:restriction endonuclease subunit S [Vibrio parahaemolyticus]